jgi:ribosomal protein S6--L-glutamate ligase
MAIIATGKTLIGWKEWCQLPALGLPAIKAKIDTGAKTSCIHATNIVLFEKKSQPWIRFTVDPIQANKIIMIECKAPVLDERFITSSSGHKERRYIIRTPIRLGHHEWYIDLSLSNRENMRFRMLLGRDALKGHTLIDPTKMHCHGRLSRQQINQLYEGTDR